MMHLQALLVAAITSSISMFEVGVAYLVEEKKLPRIGVEISLEGLLSCGRDSFHLRLDEVECAILDFSPQERDWFSLP